MKTIVAVLFVVAIAVPAYGLAPVGGGAGASGSWDEVAAAIQIGSFSSGQCLSVDSRGNIVDSGVPCAAQWNKAFAEKS